MLQMQLKDWLETIGMLAIVASLIFVGLQMQQDRSIATVESYDGVASTDLQLAELIGERSELWRRALDGEELSVEEQIQFHVLAKAVEASFLISWRRALELDIYNPESDLRDYAMGLHSHVGLRRYFETKMNRYKATDAAFNVPSDYGAFGGAVREKLKYLTANSVPVPETKAYVFWD